MYMSKNNIVSSIVGIAAGVIIGTGAFVSAAVIKETPKAGAIEKTGMELVSKSTDGQISKYVDHDANVVCYSTGSNGWNMPIALSCVNL